MFLRPVVKTLFPNEIHNYREYLPLCRNSVSVCETNKQSVSVALKTEIGSFALHPSSLLKQGTRFRLLRHHFMYQMPPFCLWWNHKTASLILEALINESNPTQVSLSHGHCCWGSTLSYSRAEDYQPKEGLLPPCYYPLCLWEPNPPFSPTLVHRCCARTDTLYWNPSEIIVPDAYNEFS